METHEATPLDFFYRVSISKLPKTLYFIIVKLDKRIRQFILEIVCFANFTFKHLVSYFNKRTLRRSAEWCNIEHIMASVANFNLIVM